MVDKWFWGFYGYQSSQGGRPVQDWWDALSEDAKDEAKDILHYMQYVPNSQWRRPEFDQLDDGISEVRFHDAALTYRIYGYFGPNRRQYTFLVGTEKKKNRQRHEQKLAIDRMKQIEGGIATTHVFEFERKAFGAN